MGELLPLFAPSDTASQAPAGLLEAEPPWD